MPDDPTNPPAGAQAGQPASGNPTPAADPNKAPTPAAAAPEKAPAVADKAGEAERQSIRERAIAAERERDDLKAKLAKIEDDKLKESGKWQELATKLEAEKKSLESEVSRERVERSIVSAGATAGAKNPSDLIPFVKLDGLDVTNAAAVQAAVDKAVADLTVSKPYMFGKSDGKSESFPTPQPNPGGETFDPRKVAAEDLYSGKLKLTPDQLRQVQASGGAAPKVDFMGRPIT